MSSPKVTETKRLSPHRRQVELVQLSLLSNVQSREQRAMTVSRLAR